jgi:glucose-1-phosphate cytidylyltransferase
MRAIILAGGLGTRLSEETYNKPKPMVKVGSLTLLEHIMEIYAFSNIKEFIIATGYLSETIEEYFKDFSKYKVTIMYTGEETQTGGRLKKVVQQLPDEMFCATYGDGLANIDINKSINFHLQHKRAATVTAVRPQARFGRLTIENQKVVRFGEKLQLEEGWVNGGFFVLNRNIIDYIDGDFSPFEAAPLKKLTTEGQLMAFEHHGFWSPVDTLREKNELEDLWVKEKAPWLVI